VDSNADRPKQHNPWDELAEELGLSESPAPPAHHDARTQPDRRDEPATEQNDIESEAPARGSEPDRELMDEMQDEGEELPPPSAFEEGQEASDERGGQGEEGKSTRSAGRRRRRRKAAGDKPNEAKPDEADVQDEVRAAPDRSRGRRRPEVEDSEDAPADEPGDEPEEQGLAASAFEEEEGEEELMNYSNWTVPSWNDLIASLYRPER
jgi:hypothetical protein